MKNKAKDKRPNSDFKDGDEALEFLIERKEDENRKKRWAEAFGTEEKDNAAKVKKTRFFKLSKIKIIGIAASLLLVLGTFLFFPTMKSSEQYSLQFIESTNLNSEYGQSTRGILETTGSDLDMLKSSLKKVIAAEDYNQALGLFNQIEKSIDLTLEDNFFYGVALLKQKNGDHHKAIRLLSNVIGTKDKYYYEALWFRALAYGSINNHIKQRLDLEKLITNSNYQSKNVNILIGTYN